MRLYAIRLGGARQNIFELPHLVLLLVPLEMNVVFLLPVLNLYTALCTVGSFEPFVQLCGGYVETRFFRSNRASPPLPDGSNVGWTVCRNAAG